MDPGLEVEIASNECGGIERCCRAIEKDGGGAYQEAEADHVGTGQLLGETYCSSETFSMKDYSLFLYLFMSRKCHITIPSPRCTNIVL